MPRIPDDYLLCTAYLYADHDAASQGRSFGGTGFIVSRPLPCDPNRNVTYVITNRHVAIDDGFPCIRLMKKDGTPHVIDLDCAE